MPRLKLPTTIKHRYFFVAIASILLGLLYWSIAPVFSSNQPATALFEQVWETVNSRFYDSNFNGVDWQALRGQYRSRVVEARSKEAPAIAINQMLSELKTSHTRLYTPDEPAYYQVLGIFQPRIPDLRKQLQPFFPKGKIEYSDIGIFTHNLDGKIFVRAILDGSPAMQANLLVGDRLLSVDGQPFHPTQSFSGKAGQTVNLQIQRSAASNSLQTIQVTPRMFDTTKMFLEAQRASTQIIKRSGKAIGYTHIWSYAGEQYQSQLEEDLIYGQIKDADALVLDLREGWGGAPITALNIYGSDRLNLTSILRDGKRSTIHAQWHKPVVMLVNENSRSAKEILAYGLQQNRLGTVVGTRTAGAVVGGFPFLMANGDLLYVAVTDVLINGNVRLEGKGVQPDIEVPFPLPYAQGIDPQKERAIETALAAAQKKS
ncbi:S41 family peptidase [Pseudanabaena sp. PCC 6802]|uniref:S41 family peptidase n=1 Tax=Pseudanabaena sp. PCC 6802 TaxID=118173 RepID=UPI00034BB9C9|nr:S41 family peptidase [Pseudanabaena sp. PCC 6802]